ncbi:GNAT family N-acetyltransferase [Achromobacter arsenitoxydans]|uniref:GNAT family acetyltransferase n=1 Tax=Achromobacter arsenitoxydans SY8 TaxID=477184 RepID=H0F7Y0_9BURK|nr:GNAT family N-acetyltransferase [Achromobacter arsenitoxydans]EHK65413.1 GNAT family acetyltransferase [Achromobacter arsenitoxydans SY8]
MNTTSKTEPVLRHLETPEELRACLPLMRALRPHLSDEADFIQRIGRMRQEHYRLLAAVQDGAAIALAGYRHQENLIYGRFLYIDDLVVDESRRGGRWGARLIGALDELARDSGCDRLVLDTGLGNALAQRFYFRQGLLTSAIRFSKPLGALPA